MQKFLADLRNIVDDTSDHCHTIPLKLSIWVCLLNFSEISDAEYKKHWNTKLLNEGDHFVNVSRESLLSQIILAEKNLELHIIG